MVDSEVEKINYFAVHYYGNNDEIVHAAFEFGKGEYDVSLRNYLQTQIVDNGNLIKEHGIRPETEDEVDEMLASLTDWDTLPRRLENLKSKLSNGKDLLFYDINVESLRLSLQNDTKIREYGKSINLEQTMEELSNKHSILGVTIAEPETEADYEFAQVL